jgi:hypothetical protein
VAAAGGWFPTTHHPEAPRKAWAFFDASASSLENGNTATPPTELRALRCIRYHVINKPSIVTTTNQINHELETFEMVFNREGYWLFEFECVSSIAIRLQTRVRAHVEQTLLPSSAEAPQLFRYRERLVCDYSIGISNQNCPLKMTPVVNNPSHHPHFSTLA